jgi:hypothetical protein
VVDKKKLHRMAGLLATGIITVYPYVVATSQVEETGSAGGHDSD